MNDISTQAMLARPTRSQLIAREAALQAACEQLKSELFGIDEVIDRVMEAVRPWYVLPQLIRRPVIVCLWGLTGTGKTRLTRRLAELLGFLDRFVEVQMDGFSHSAGWSSSTISGMLEDAGLQEGEPAVLVLDEFQRYRTVSRKGEDAAPSRYQDVWTLLSDGKLPPPIGGLLGLHEKLAETLYDQDKERHDNDPAEEGAPASSRRPARAFKLDPWDAKALKRQLKRPESLTDIMRWSTEQIQTLVAEHQRNSEAWSTDYSRLLVFVCGNLDEMYEGVATRVEDCDTDADVFHRLTRRLSQIDVKKALNQRFRPEQIARLGHQHIVFPSLSRSAYEQIIETQCAHYVEDILEQTGVALEVDPAVLRDVYDNAVFPSQGTRPLYSAMHAMLAGPLTAIARWALMHAETPAPVHVGLHPSGDLCGERRDTPAATEQSVRVPRVRELDAIRRKSSPDFRTLLAVHEAGHGLIYALLLGHAPQEIRINLASYEGGYNSFVRFKVTTRQNMLDMICTGLAGRAAEELAFGRDASTTGAEQDIREATEDASRYVRFLGFEQSLGRTDVCDSTEQHMVTGVAGTDAAIEQILQAQYRRATELLQEHHGALVTLVAALLAQGSLDSATLCALLARHGVVARNALAQEGHELVTAPFADRWERFSTITLNQ